MKTLLLSATIKFLVPLFIIFALFMLLRGHNQPGGGFIAGLIVTIPFIVHSLAFGPNQTKKEYKVNPFMLVPTGLLLAMLSGVFSILKGQPFMTGLWSIYDIPFISKTGTPILFDVGVFMTVAGVVLQITFLANQD